MTTKLITEPIVQEFDWGPERPQIHWSNMNTLWMCGVRFEFRYIKKVRFMPSTAIHVGRAVDASANRNLDFKIATDTLLPTDEVLDIARDATRESFDQEGVHLGPDEPGDERAACDLAVDKAVRLARLHATALAPVLQPESVQRRWEMEIAGLRFDVVGNRDVDETTGRIRDLKTAKRSPRKDEAWVSDQGTLYAMARWAIDGLPTPIHFTLDKLVDLKSGPRLSSVHSVRNVDDFKVITARLENAQRVIESGVFTPANQQDWWCSEQYCDYALMCPYFRRPASVSVGEQQHVNDTDDTPDRVAGPGAGGESRHEEESEQRDDGPDAP